MAFYCNEADAWDNEVTHKELSKYATDASLFNSLSYFRNLGLNEGLKQKLKGNSATKTIMEWLQEGAYDEDAGSDMDAIWGNARFNNHFHNPLKEWNEAGLNDSITIVIPSIPPYYYTSTSKGESALKWAQDSLNQNSYAESKGLKGDQTWQATKGHYYKALTGQKHEDREAEFARTFKGLGHQMHLIQDMAVPAHVRNDAHPEDAKLGRNYLTGDMYFETWAKRNNPDINSLATKPVYPEVDLSKAVAGGLSPITQFYDADQYTESFVPSRSPTWGLSEYTNANFVSDTTIFTERFDKNDRHYFPYPRYTDYTSCYEQYEEQYLSSNKMRKYWRKKAGGCSGEAIEHFVQVEPWFQYAPTWNIQRWALHLDEATIKDYAEKLVPRAVGYSAGLLNYFFRGQIRLVSDANNPGQHIIQNNSAENMRGIFSLYYDNLNGNRILIKKNLGYGLLTLNAKQASDPVVFDIPSDAKEPGKYILVFQGTLGAESGSVAGYVTSRLLEITPPDQFIYSMVNADSAKPEFANIKVKIKNASNEAMQNGTLQAVAKYKKTTDDPNFLFSVSTPQTGIALGATAQEYSFNFTTNPIPVDATDLYLEIFFKGTIGTEQGATAIGIKDISEPTPIDLFNNTDRSCLNNKWYESGSPAAIAQVDKNNDGDANDRNEWDVYPHKLKNIYIKISSPETPQQASPTVNNYVLPELDAGQFRRTIYILTDDQFKYSVNTVWESKGPDDLWGHSTMTYLHSGTAVKNQTVYTSDPAICGSDILCDNYSRPGDYFVRGSNMWWGGGIVFIDSPYPATSSCQGYE